MKTCNKPIIQTILTETENDVRSRTGRNLRKILNQSGKNALKEMNMTDINRLNYVNINDDDQWKVDMLLGLVEERKYRELDQEEKEWIDYLCCD